jgi:hypothetical protein
MNAGDTIGSRLYHLRELVTDIDQNGGSWDDACEATLTVLADAELMYGMLLAAGLACAEEDALASMAPPLGRSPRYAELRERKAALRAKVDATVTALQDLAAQLANESLLYACVPASGGEKKHE